MNFLRNLLGRKRMDAGSAQESELPPSEIVVDGASVFPIKVRLHEGYPMMAWDAVGEWLSCIELPEHQGAAWTAAERAWLLHMRKVLGRTFELRESSNAMLLSSMDPNVARSTLEYMERTLQRVVKVLDGIALTPSFGKELLLVFDDDESYYRYVSLYYRDAGEFAFSGGMHIDAGCSHYVTVKNDLRVIEPVIAHEMTHGCLGHLPLPAWLNEGLAVNVEQRLAPTASTYTQQELRSRHLTFWGQKEVQEFWSGKSFLRTDEGNLLSYALASLIVEQMALDWESFKRFTLAADGVDAGAAAAKKCLNIDLGEFLCVLLEKTPSSAWSPDPSKWDGAPERGRFVSRVVHSSTGS